MGKRRRPNRHPTKAIVDRLSIRPPFAKDEWARSRLSSVLENPVYLDYFEQCRLEIARSGRGEVYMARLAGFAHIGRLPEFAPRSYDKFFQEAKDQHVSIPKMEMALDTILNGIAQGHVRLNPVEQFEFMSFVGDFASCLAEHFGTTDRLEWLIMQARGVTLASFVLAVNAEFDRLAAGD
jgi:hypothetical protein